MTYCWTRIANSKYNQIPAHKFPDDARLALDDGNHADTYIRQFENIPDGRRER